MTNARGYKMMRHTTHNQLNYDANETLESRMQQVIKAVGRDIYHNAKETDLWAAIEHANEHSSLGPKGMAQAVEIAKDMLACD